LESSGRDLSDVHPFVPLQPQNFIIHSFVSIFKTKIERKREQHLCFEVLPISSRFSLISTTFSRIFPDLLENAEETLHYLELARFQKTVRNG